MLKKIAPLFCLILLVGCTRETPEIKVKNNIEDAQLTFDLFGEIGLANNAKTPVFSLTQNNTTKINLRIGSTSSTQTMLDVLKEKYNRTTEQQLLSELQFGLRKSFSLNIENKYQVACALYHAEPQLMNQDGQRIVLFFDLNDTKLDYSQPVSAHLIIQNDLFSSDEITIPLILQSVNTSDDAPQ